MVHSFVGKDINYNLIIRTKQNYTKSFGWILAKFLTSFKNFFQQYKTHYLYRLKFYSKNLTTSYVWNVIYINLNMKHF